MAVEEYGDEHMHHAQSQLGAGVSQHSLSMREKSQIKRRINKEHNSNFRAGYININEEYLHKTGLRGRKSYFLYCFIALLVLVALCNALLTAWLVYKFRIYHVGMAPMEFLPESNSVRFLEETDIRTMKMSNARLGGRYAQDLNLIAVNATMLLGAKHMDGSTLKLRGSRAFLSSNNFTVRHKGRGKTLFWTGDEKTYIPLKHAKNLHALSVQVRKLRSREGFQDLVLESHKHITVLGAEGVHIASEKGVTLQPFGSVILNATGSIHLELGNSIYLNQSLPRPSKGSLIDPDLINYKLCVCGNNGRVFGVPIQGPGSGCNSLDARKNPCQL